MAIIKQLAQNNGVGKTMMSNFRLIREYTGKDEGMIHGLSHRREVL